MLIGTGGRGAHSRFFGTALPDRCLYRTAAGSGTGLNPDCIRDRCGPGTADAGSRRCAGADSLGAGARSGSGGSRPGLGTGIAVLGCGFGLNLARPGAGSVLVDVGPRSWRAANPQQFQL